MSCSSCCVLRWRSLLVFLLLLAFPIPLIGQEAYYLNLGGEGTASVIISRDDKVAFITDGGRRRDGITSARIEGQKILTFLKGAKIERLVITCSHPHADHMRGLEEMIKDPDILGFRQIDFVDSGYEEHHVHKGVKSLDTIFRETWDSRYRNEGANFEGTEATRKLPTIAKHTAHNRDAFERISYSRQTVVVSNFVYEPTTTHPHGDCVVTRYTLRRGERTINIVDFDDANSELVARYAEWVRNAPSERRPDVAVMPHHGSNLTDIRQLLADEVRPKSFVFTVDSDNRYRHPGPENLEACLEKVGIENVHFTGASSNVKISELGVSKKTISERRRDIALIIDPQIRRTFKDLTDAEALPNVDRIAKLRTSYEALHRIRSLYMDDAVPEQPTQQLVENTGKYGDILRRVEQEYGQSIQHRRNEPDLPPGGVVGPVSRPPGGPLGGSSEVTSRPPSSLPVRPASVAPSPNVRIRRSSPSFQRHWSLRPVFGGIILGNDTSEQSDLLRSASIVIEAGIPLIQVEVQKADGTKVKGAFSEMSVTDLWSAYNFVSPSPEMATKFNIAGGECGLVGMTSTGILGLQWHFGIHPAIANTSIARDAMRLDMAISAADESSAFATEFRQSGQSNYQWYDDPATIRVEDGVVTVMAEKEPRAFLLRVRLWGRVTPAWLRGDGETSPNDLVEREIAQRYANRVKAAGLEQSAPYRLEMIRQQVTSNDEATLTRETNLEAAYDSAVKAAGLANSPHYRLERLQREWLKQLFARTDEPPAATARTYNERITEEGLDNLPQVQMARIREKVIQTWREKLSQSQTEEEIERLVEKQEKEIQQAFRQAGLDRSDDYRLEALREEVEQQVAAELEGYLDAGDATKIPALADEFRPLERLERFARTVAVLNWIKRECGSLPPLPANLMPKRANVSPSLNVTEVFDGAQAEDDR